MKEKITDNAKRYAELEMYEMCMVGFDLFL